MAGRAMIRWMLPAAVPPIQPCWVVLVGQPGARLVVDNEPTRRLMHWLRGLQFATGRAELLTVCAGAVLADARLTRLEEKSFELAVPEGYDWHFGKIQEGRALLETVAESLLPGCSPKLECGLGGEKAAPPKENEHEELVKRASGVFGGSSVVD